MSTLQQQLEELCFSHAPDVKHAAAQLLDAGAVASQRALYGAAGVRHDEPLTRLLLHYGADPNDDEVPYHTPEGYDNGAMRAIVESGRLTAENLATMLARKHDWHDLAGVQWLLQQGADPNFSTRWGRTPFGQAVLRDNSIELIEAELNFGGDPNLGGPATPAQLAARRGRGDVLKLLAARRLEIQLEGADLLLAACACDDAAGVRRYAEYASDATAHLAEFAGNGNTAGVEHLLDLGADVNARYTEPDGYWSLGADTTPMHIAAWRIRHGTVKMLIDRGGDIHARDGEGRTPLQMAIRACVDSYWKAYRSVESIAALIEAGASMDSILLPTGYDEADRLLSPTTSRPAQDAP